MTLLYIEDDEDDIHIFKEAVELTNQKTVLHIARDAREAFKMLEELTILPDLIFLDINLPEIPGQQFLKTLKSTHGLKTVPVVVYSTTGHLHDIEECKRLGASDFIIKPNKFDQLVTILQKFIE